MSRSNPAPLRFHAFDRLVMTITESSLEGVVTDLIIELRATETGVEVWRSSVLIAGGETCGSDERLIGILSARHVVELLEEIERTGVYEALPALGIVDGASSGEIAPRVAIRLESGTRSHTVLEDARADEVVTRDVVRAVRDRVEIAQERALSRAG